MASEKDIETPSGGIQSCDECDSTHLGSQNGPLNAEKSSKEDQEIKDGGYGWVIVASVFLILFHSFGINSMFGVFLAFYLKSNTYPGATPLQFAFIGGLCFSVAFIVPPFAALLSRRLGVRITVIIGGIFISGAYIAASFSKTIWQLILSQGVCYGIGMGICFIGTASIVTQYFTKKRSLAVGIATSGTGFGGLTYSLAANNLIYRVGIEWTFRIMAIICFVVITASALFLKDHNKNAKAAVKAVEWKLFKMLDFWLFLGWLWLSSLGYVVVVFSLSAYAQGVGFTAQQGSLVSAMFNLSTGIGRPIIGLLCDRFGTIRITMLGTFISSLITFFIWIFGGKSYGGLIVYSLLGFFPSLLWATFVVVAAKVFGLKMMPAAISLSILTLALPYTFAEAIGLSLRKSGVNGFLDVQIFAGVMFAASTVCCKFTQNCKLYTG
ncbi:MFS general substrate transporter [Trichoderma citrinoviride]|uniref:MFS general substrate transporter n=1 Tax=Trichoderma citrinoviride TaxID=58853 RepID=A0A2T4BGD1_9HYPO|nr:MFS general substrate transporter [Trichoderma citrinoviride]PTB68383.1 MFS general substrate transporter [Trichoderma citrinoviride]